MKPVVPAEGTLGRYSGPLVILECRTCARHGRYKTEGLRDRLGPETFMAEVAQLIAEISGCARARRDLIEGTANGPPTCGAHLDVDRSWET